MPPTANTEAPSTTLFDKLWSTHVIVRRDNGDALLWVDRLYLHEGSFHAFEQLAARNLTLAEPGLVFGFADHYVPTHTRDKDIANPEIARMVRTLNENASHYGFKLFGLHDPNQGIVHVVGPEQGLTLPGVLIVCGDSHTSTHGGLGAYAFGIGASEVAHVLMTQTIWQRRPANMRISVEGELGPGIGAKDIALSVISRIGANGAQGHAVEYAGSAIRGLSVEARLTLCNMSIEAGARCGVIAPDEKTFAYVKGRPYAPQPDQFDDAVDRWSLLVSDPDATFEREHSLSTDDIAPIVTWGTSPEDALPIDANVPDPAREADAERAMYVRKALDYMDLAPGRRLTDISIDEVFIGSCTNARIEDLRAAAAILAGRKSKVPGKVSPGSSAVKLRAEQEGLDRIFRAAGLEWVEFRMFDVRRH